MLEHREEQDADPEVVHLEQLVLEDKYGPAEDYKVEQLVLEGR